MGWNCTACTFRNVNDGAKKCFTCETARKPTKKAAIDLTNDNDSKLAAGQKRGSGTQLSLTFSGGSGSKSKDKASKKQKTATIFEERDSTAPQSTMSLSTAPQTSYAAISNDPYEARAARSREVMKNVFQIKKLRNQQPLAVECTLKGTSSIVVMATGGGKSLCYQLPAVVIGGTTIVISPLIALMRDQVDSLLKKGIAAACINSSNKEKDNAEIMDRLVGRRLNPTKRPKKDEPPLRPITLVYVTPESLQTPKFQSILKELAAKKRLAGFAIDEAHCMSSWGHDFRPAYRKLDYLATQFAEIPRIALTATATPKVVKDIQKVLKLEKAPCHVGSFDRPNIFYKVHYKDGLEGIQKGGSLNDIAKFIQKQHKRAKKDDKPISGIVYCFKRDDTIYLSKEISKRTGIKAVAYHGKLKDDDRTKVQQDWTSGEVKIVVATIAFGMGIDLAHVRYVIHWTIPKTMDGFYQESGRAGRDGLPAISLVYFSRDDAKLFAFLINKTAENRKKPNGVGDSSKKDSEALEQVVNYCTNACCRREFVLKHFGEKETDPATICEKSCDYCRNPKKIEQAIRSSESMRTITYQKKEAEKRRKKAKEWDGQWDRPHGDDGFNDRFDEDWEVDGLGITSSAKVKPSNFSANTSFVSAKSLASKIDSLEAMELQENESNGFVKFKSVKKERDPFPEHFREQLKMIPLSTNAAKEKPKERSSSEIKENADNLREQLAAIEAQKEALLKKRGSDHSSSKGPAPPPPPSFQQSKRKKSTK